MVGRSAADDGAACTVRARALNVHIACADYIAVNIQGGVVSDGNGIRKGCTKGICIAHDDGAGAYRDGPGEGGAVAV